MSSVSIGLIAAIREEVRPLLRRVRAFQSDRIGGFPCHRFTLHGRSCLLVESGMGRARAAAAVGALVAHARPRLVISFGVAGGVRDSLHVGDVVDVAGVRLLENGTLSSLSPIEAFPEPARRAAASILLQRGAGLFLGTAITTGGEQAADFSPEIAHPVLEMETEAIARVCTAHAVPLFALRAISDSVQEPLPFDLKKYVDEEQNLRLGRILGDLLRHPWLLPRLLRTAGNAHRAADNLAAALCAAVQMLPTG